MNAIGLGEGVCLCGEEPRGEPDRPADLRMLSLASGAGEGAGRARSRGVHDLFTRYVEAQAKATEMGCLLGRILGGAVRTL